MNYKFSIPVNYFWKHSLGLLVYALGQVVTDLAQLQTDGPSLSLESGEPKTEL